MTPRCGDKEIYLKKECRPILTGLGHYYRKIYNKLSKEDRTKIREFYKSEDKLWKIIRTYRFIDPIWNMVLFPLWLIISASLPEKVLYSPVFWKCSIFMLCMHVLINLLNFFPVSILSPYRKTNSKHSPIPVKKPTKKLLKFRRESKHYERKRRFRLTMRMFAFIVMYVLFLFSGALPMLMNIRFKMKYSLILLRVVAVFSALAISLISLLLLALRFGR